MPGCAISPVWPTMTMPRSSLRPNYYPSLTAMAARELSERSAAVAAVAVSLLIVGMTVWYYRINVQDPVEPAYGLYVGAGAAVAAVLCSVWSLIRAMSRSAR